MFERPHHRRILRVLAALDGELLAQARCYFGGGTAIVLALGEYRESVDVDFICSDRSGYRALRSAVALPTLGRLLRTPLPYRREARTGRDKISAFVEVDGVPIKVEFVLEARIDVDGAMDPVLGVPVLGRVDMYAEKLLANADRGLDRSTMSRDLVDLGMMICRWGAIPRAAWAKAEAAYGPGVRDAYAKALALLETPDHRRQCLHAMGMDQALGDGIVVALKSCRPATAPDEGR